MKCKSSVVIAVLFLANCYLCFAQVQSPATTPSSILHNGDILRMHSDGVKASAIVSKIVSSHCNFDIFPPVLRDLKRRGVPDMVLLLMTMVPYGPPAAGQQNVEPIPLTARAQIPAGTLIEIVAASPISSANAREHRAITFLVSRPVVVNGVTVIARGAVARAQLVSSKRAGAWGRAGSLGWALEDVVAVDGTLVPIKLSGRLAGKSRSKAVVAAAIATGAVVFPYSPPAGLIWALKRGDEAVLDQSKKSAAIVSRTTDVEGLVPQPQKVIYHPVEHLKAVDTDKGTGLAPASNSFHPTSIRKN